MDATPLSLLLLADGRFPAGGHVHSAGVEAAVVDGRVTDLASLEAFLLGRLHTSFLADAAIAAATVHRLGTPGGPGAEAALRRLDDEAEARIAPPPLRAASRRQGRQLLRVAAACWPSPVLVVASTVDGGLHQAVALGAVATAAGIPAAGAAAAAVHHGTSIVVQAGVRLLGLDPFGAAAVLARAAADGDTVIAGAAAMADRPLEELPAGTGLLVDLAALDHERREPRMFAT